VAALSKQLEPALFYGASGEEGAIDTSVIAVTSIHDGHSHTAPHQQGD
jgi:hypothetical protein